MSVSTTTKAGITPAEIRTAVDNIAARLRKAFKGSGLRVSALFTNFKGSIKIYGLNMRVEASISLDGHKPWWGWHKDCVAVVQGHKETIKLLTKDCVPDNFETDLMLAIHNAMETHVKAIRMKTIHLERALFDLGLDVNKTTCPEAEDAYSLLSEYKFRLESELREAYEAKDASLFNARLHQLNKIRGFFKLGHIEKITQKEWD